MNCERCQKRIDKHDEIPYVIINEGLKDEKLVCYDCHVEMLDNGITTTCESCTSEFEYHNLKINPKTQLQELCPYCGEIWCE